MSNKKSDVSQFYEMEANIEKKSSHFIIGYQPKVWKIFDNGTKIAYRNPQENVFLPQKTFNISDIKTEEVDAVNQFELITSNRVYELRMETQEQCRYWIRAICMLKKELKRKSRKKSPAPKKQMRQPKKQNNDSTLPSIAVKPIPMQVKQSMQSNPLTYSAPARNSQLNMSRTEISFSFWSQDQDQLKLKYQEHFKKLSPDYLQYHVYIAKLKTKVKDFFLSKAASHLYVLFSSKSLSPDEHISQENLTSAYLPHWADVDSCYRISQANVTPKIVFSLSAVSAVIVGEGGLSLRVRIDNDEIQQYFFDTVQDQTKFKQILDIAHCNALECKNVISRRNYDGLIMLHGSNLQEFNLRIKQMIFPLVPMDHQYQPWVVKKFTDNLYPMLNEVLTVLQNKMGSQQQKIRRMIIDFVKVVHEQMKSTLKLVWDSSHSKVKGLDILNILKAVSTYESLVNKYVVKDKQIYQAQKQLSKIYVRTLYHNFEKIIINIVEKQRSDNYFILEEDDEEDNFAQTHAITDLFKFLYDFFNLAIPCWNDRLHLHNIHKLTRRTLSVFVQQLKSMVDEQQISTVQLIAISNNYVSFNQQVQEFYNDKFVQLKEQTKECYDQLQNEFREISMVIIDRLVLPLKIQLKTFFNRQTFFDSQMERVYNMIVESEICRNMSKVHFIFKKRYFQRIFSTIREEICKMLEKEVDSLKKKRDIERVVERVRRYIVDCLQMADLLVQQKIKIQKELNEIVVLLTTQRRDEIAFIITEASDLYKRIYKKICTLREDYSSLGTILATNEIDSPLKAKPGFLNVEKIMDDLDERKSFSRYYIQEYDRSSIQFSSEKVQPPPSQEQKIKMISQGFLSRNKFNSGHYERIYLKLKKSVLYIYENETTDRCQNTVQVEDIQEVRISSVDPAQFVICFQGLQRLKQMQLRCESVEERLRWVYSIECEFRRLKNDKKMKVIKSKQLKCHIIIDYDQMERGKDYFSYSDEK